ncbi:hypothetical protein JCM16814_28250 [Desulfobaculum senezii]
MAVEKRKNKSGRVSYRAYWRNPATRRIERGPWTTHKKAEKLSEEMKFRLKYEPESFEVAVPASSALVTDILAAYLTGANLTESTRKSTFYHLKKVAKLMDGLTVQELTAAHMTNIERRLRTDGYAQPGINRKIGIVLAAMTWAKDQRLIDSIPINPLEYRCKRGRDKRTPPPTPNQIAELLEAAPPHICRAIVLGYYTGARTGPSELLRIKWEDVAFRERFVRIHSANKNDEIQWRDIYIDDNEIWHLLSQWCAADMAGGFLYVIHYRGKPITTFKKAWRNLFDRVNKTRGKRNLPPIPYCKPYSLRHAFVTELLAQGANLKAASELAGHSDTTTTTRIYQHTNTRDRKEASRHLPKLQMGHSDEDHF